ncbi:adenylosuccinate synthase [Rapidithrix thailandica]|uniref:Adenylosuccinate synthetase n=1 Tax=Rapidithrix thailandica TaxID=413964 RepID=A0AAW9SFP1_9BACT
MDILLGLQWGDEGKGKVVDFLAPKYDIIARFQGGPNAGHTLEFDGKKYVLHQIPSGVFQAHTINIIGSGVVLDLNILKQEITKLKEGGFDVTQNLLISKKAHLILPSHRLLDAAYEAHKGKDKIGSTLKGIGPTYQDKIGRLGLRIGDILTDNFYERYQKLLEAHLAILDYYKFEYTQEQLKELEDEYFQSIEFIKTLQLVDSEYYINQALLEGKKILAEGAQGCLLDIDFGSYPFVTSSNTFSAGASTGLGVAPRKLRKVFGIFKAYCTRVGSGPFPSELFDDAGQKLREEGREFGSTTGRPRRCGWVDLPMLKYAVMINGVSELLMMKADVLNNFDEIKVCTHYKLEDGTITDEIPFDIVNAKLEPVYKSFKGWQSDVSPEIGFDGLPVELKEYINYIQEELEVPITLVSVGPDRKQTIVAE